MIIGLHGLAGSGKDTTYEFIADWARDHSLTPRREAFADRLKLSAARAIGYFGGHPIEFCNSLKRAGVYIEVIDHDYPESNIRMAISGRQYLQLYGTEAHREVFGQDFWIAAVMNTYQPDEVLVVTDVRFPNEADAIHEEPEGSVWYIERPGIDVGDSHVSERSLPADSVDRLILNTGSLDDLRTHVFHTLELLTV